MRDTLRDEVDLALISVYAGKDYNPNQPRGPHTGEWISAPGLPDAGSWFWDDNETRFGIETPDAVAAQGVQPGTQAAAAAKAYTTGSYRDLNARLMAARPLTPEQEAIAQSLHGAMKPLPEPVTVFRGVRGIGPIGRDEPETFRLLGEWATKHFPVGATVELGGFQSTSFDTQPALDGSLSKQSPGILFEIRAKNGAYLGSVTQFSDEAELLLAGGRYRIRKVLPNGKVQDKDGDPRRRVIVQLIQL